MTQPFLARLAQQHWVRRIHPNEPNKFVLLADPVADGAAFVQVIEIFDLGGCTPPNRHQAAQELFLVLHGSGEAEVDGVSLPLQAGSTLLLMPGCTHVVRNTGETRLYCLTTMVPNEEFAELIRSGTPASLDEEDLRVLGWS